MIIASYDVKASSQRTFLSVQSTSMAAKREVRPASGSVSVSDGGNKTGKAYNVSISDAVKEMYKKYKDDSNKLLAQKAKTQAVGKTGKGPRAPSTPEELKLSLLEMMIELMTGKKVKLRMYNPAGDEDGAGAMNHQGGNIAGIMSFQDRGGTGQMQAVEVWNLEHFQYEYEQVSYQANGIINTSDGRTVNIDINMYMSREFAAYTSVSVEIKKPCDPLVINYGGTAASLLDEKFDFDLTMDGRLDKLSILGKGSGFLAIDKNGDGKINDGSELFGPSTGNGFNELRAYDIDGNGWIDEADEVFSKLIIWSHDKDGNDQYFTLTELGIGAIFLGDIDTQFSFKDDDNQTQAIMRSTSFFLGENGGGGTISHLDMFL